MRDDGRTVRWIAGFTSVAMGVQQEPVRGTVELMYRVRDPFAVTAAFRTGRNKRVIWTFARDLLGEGLRSPTGAGDVRVEPWRDEPGRQWASAAWPGHGAGSNAGRVLITLRSPAGRTLVTISRKDVSGFLGLTYDLVPEGEESARADIDGELVKLLA